MAKKKARKKRAPVSKKFIPQASIVSDELYIPNHSGMLDAGKVHRTPTDNLDPVNKKYVDDEIAAIPPVDITGKLDKDGGNANQTIDIGSEDLTTTGDIQAVTANLAGMDISNDGTKTTFLGKSGDYNRIGDAAATSHSLASNDDLLITGKLEVNGEIFSDATAGITIDAPTDGKGMISIKENGVSAFRFYAHFNNEQTLLVTRSSLGRTMIMTDYDSRESPHDHGVQTNPTFYVHSATNPNTNNTQWLSLTHDQTDGVITTGTGDINLAPAGGLQINGTAGFTGTGAYTNFTIQDGIITGAT